MGEWDEPFIGSEALTEGTVTRAQLRARYRAVFPDVYVACLAKLSAKQRTVAAWLWSRRRATIAGLAAAGLHAAKWIDDDLTVELVHTNPRSPQGIVTRRDVLLEDEVTLVDGRGVTTPERTAFDIARRGSIMSSVARLDALARASGLKIGDVADLASRHHGVRGLRHLESVLDLVDTGAQSPKETWVRLVLIEAGFPRPQTQIPVLGPDGIPVYYLDMGWEDWQLAVEYEGEDHQAVRSRYVGDVHRLEYVQDIGWQIVRVVAEDRRADVVRRVGRAAESRGFRVR
jgi:hypothetical protein